MYRYQKSNSARSTPKSLWHIALTSFPLKILMHLYLYLGLTSRIFYSDSIKNLQAFRTNITESMHMDFHFRTLRCEQRKEKGKEYIREDERKHFQIGKTPLDKKYIYLGL